ncbi:hypothetical protein VCRA2113O415_580005 [Vibrio crassostreae]|nr:hypothetical protein VCRA2113O415_580005 [Vibrio crassostreae]CAK2918646.1 hypothetical protein VCRA2113O420_570007 [Vibrio crassostreae]CAK3527858.1 hypothetical protein VCRA2121O436_550005 [Vibrio crassostreae]
MLAEFFQQKLRIENPLKTPFEHNTAITRSNALLSKPITP